MRTEPGVTGAGEARPPFGRGSRNRSHADALTAARGLWFGLAMASGVIGLVQALVGATPASAALVVVANLALAARLLHTLRSRRQGPLTELVTLAALGLFAYAADPPAAVAPAAIALAWFQALYGSRRASVVRPVTTVAVLAAALALPSAGPGLGTGPAAPLAWTLPLVLLTAFVGRLFSEGAREGALNAQLGAIQVRLATRILGEPDYDELVRAGLDAHGALCTVFPGLRLLLLEERELELDVRHAAGTFADVPGSVPRPPSGPEPGPMRADPATEPAAAALDAASGAPCAWHWFEAPEQREDGPHSWLVLGAPGAIPERAVTGLAFQLDQMSQALRYQVIHEQLAVQAHRDQLTGLHNRASFLAELTASLVPGEALSVLFVDLDGFKEINDLFGHRAGDRLLADVARRLCEASGPEAVCARIGGDEFGVVLRGADAAAAAATAHRIAHGLSTATHPDGSPAHIGACIGIATADGAADAGELVHRADIAMYAAKSTGGGRISAYDPSLPQRDLQQAAFERALAAAAENGELVVHYQPVVSYPGTRCTAVEALVRWQHPERGLIFPDSFIHTAERTGAIRSIGSAVLRQSLLDVAHWRRELPGQPLAVHVNVSALQLEDDDLLDQVRHELTELSLEPEALVLEVTESLAISSPDAVRRLHALADLGVVLAIDDFGTGYSALQTLRTLPIRIVKIDRSFVAGSSHNPEDRAVVESIVHMADLLGLTTVAEGVEEPEQQAFVESIGATGGQGYLYRRPGSAEELTAWFADRTPLPPRAGARRRRELAAAGPLA